MEGAAMPQMSFKLNLTEEIYDRINRYSKETGVKKVFFVTKAIETYLDIVAGRVSLKYREDDNGEKN